MESLRIGHIITDDQKRDAVHMAIVPVIAAEPLLSGEHVGIDVTGRASANEVFQVGIVDPFLRQGVAKGEKFWLFLYPGSITSLRHDWDHPAFVKQEEPPPDIQKAKTWLEAFAQKRGHTYKEIMDAVENSNDGVLYEPEEQFWTNYELVTGRKVPCSERQYFVCC